MPTRTPRLIAAVTVLLASTGCDRPQLIEADLAFVDVAVIPMTSDSVLERQTVLVRDGVIVAVAAAGRIEPDEEAVTVDAAGKFLIPGLADMHVHVLSEPELPLYVANGVTLVRNMWGGPETLALRRRIEAGEILGPRIVTAGRMVDGDPPIWGEGSAVVTSPEQARAVMGEQQSAGFDFLKIYNGLSVEAFDSIAAHSKQTGFPFGGHIPDAVPLDHALSSEIRSIEHLTGWSDAERIAGGPYRSRAEYGDPGERLASRTALARRIRAGELSWEDVFDPARRHELARLAARHNVWNVPTLVVLKRATTSRRQAAAEFARPEMRYIAPDMRAMWNPDTDFRVKNSTDENLELLQAYFEADLARVKALADAGAPLLAGSDAPNPFVLPGFAIHEELVLFNQAGLSPYEALVTATRAPAQFLGELDQGGTIEVGKRADLVLLDANPMQNIAATRDIAGVVLGGRWRPQPELEQTLETVADRYALPEDWFADLAPLEDGLATERYALFYNDAEYGAERFATSTRDGLRTIVAQRSARHWGDAVTETVRYETGAAGSLVSLVYTQSEPSGTAEVRASVDGTALLVSGHSIDGTEVSQSIELAEGATVVCDFVACVGPIIDALGGLPVGESREFDVVTLETFGGLRFEPERWTLTRAPDEDGTRVYEGTARRRSDQSSFRLTVDDRGLKTQRMTGRLAVTEARRMQR